MGDVVAFGRELRRWRRSLGLSQLRLAVEAGVSPRHLSFIESGRAQPSRHMVLRLANQLRLAPGEQNALLLAAGFAPLFAARELDAPAGAVRAAAARVLVGHEPHPAIALDRRRNVVMANRAASLFIGELGPALRQPPLNIYRVLLHPDGLAPRIVGFAAYARLLVARLRRDAQVLGDPALLALLAEVEAYPGVDAAGAGERPAADVALALRLRDAGGELAFIPTLAGLGAPFEIATSELVVEALLPANEHTARRVREGVDRALTTS